MNSQPILKYYNLIKVNPSNEIWLKSMKVRMRMLKTLMNNIKISLKGSGLSFHKCQLSKDSTRIFFFFDNIQIPEAIKVFEKVMGIYSFNPTLRTSNKIKNINEKLILVGNEILQNEDTFALRVKRSGSHEFSSHDVAVQGGNAIIDNFKDLHLKVNLSNPMKKIFIEVRDEFSYIYTDTIKTKWGGMPIEKNKKIVVSDLGRLNDLLAGFLLMRRGCEIYPILFQLTRNSNFIEFYKENWNQLIGYSHNFDIIVKKINFTKIIDYITSNLKEKKFLCAICKLARLEAISIILDEFNFEDLKQIRGISDGVSLNNATICPDEVDLETISLNYLFSTYPIFTSIIGLESNEIDQFLENVSENLVHLDYCQFKPENQVIEIGEVKKIYKSLNLTDLIIESLNTIEEFNII